ncbi:MAG: ankyrin repeat domain-containing protein [Rhodospirillales bacterium]
MRRSIFLICFLVVLTSDGTPQALRAADLPATTTTLDLVRAAAAGDQARLALLLPAGADPTVVGADWRGPLHHAVLLGRLDMVRALVRAGARVDWQDVDKATPLILAAHGNYPDVAEYLILAGADPLVADRWGRRALDYALMRGKNDAVARMLRRAEINRPLHENK